MFRFPVRPFVPVIAALLLPQVSALAADLRVPQDHATIAEAVAAASPGDSIVIAPGTYFERLDVTKDGLRFTGKGVVLDGLHPDGSTGAILTVTGQGTILEGITFANGLDQVSLQGDDAVLLRCTFRDCVDDAVSITGNGAVLERCRFLGAGDSGIEVSGSGARISACRMTLIGSQGIEVFGDDALIERCTVLNSEEGPAIRVAGNRAAVLACRVVLVDNGGIVIEGDDARVEDCLVTSSDENGVTIQGNDPTILRNRFLTISEGRGVEVSGGTGGLIEGNFVRNCTDVAIDVSNTNAVIRGNRVLDAGASNSTASGFGLFADGILCEGNSVTRVVGNAFVTDGSSITIRDCVARSATRVGFFLQDGTGLVVERVAAKGCLLAGIYSLSPDATVRDSTFRGARKDVAADIPFVTFTGNRFVTGGPDVPLFE